METSPETAEASQGVSSSSPRRVETGSVLIRQLKQPVKAEVTLKTLAKLYCSTQCQCYTNANVLALDSC